MTVNQPPLRTQRSSAMVTQSEVHKGRKVIRTSESKGYQGRNRQGVRLDDGTADDDTMERGSPLDESAPLRLEDFLPYRLNVLASLMSQALSSVYAQRFNIGVPEWRVLVTLGQYSVMTGKAIGTHTHMHKTKVSRAVADLERRKLVTRRVNRADLRESFLSLTPAGRGIYEELAPSALAFARKLAEVIDPVDRSAFERALQRLTERSKLLAAEVADIVDGKEEK
jgi:DNA-binding MarR family transcriptional regulator